mmetsp:Transcript_47607/g.101166  ORF Transcript_47607/g.101166 Transcript_47607/m.101166 type:complete len:259 (-) Transcript_47607:1031-1807(-)
MLLILVTMQEFSNLSTQVNFPGPPLLDCPEHKPTGGQVSRPRPPQLEVGLPAFSARRVENLVSGLLRGPAVRKADDELGQRHPHGPRSRVPQLRIPREVHDERLVAVREVANEADEVIPRRHAAIVDRHGRVGVALVHLHRDEVDAAVAVIRQEVRVDVVPIVMKVTVPSPDRVSEVDVPAEVRAGEVEVALGRRHRHHVPLFDHQAADLSHLVKAIKSEYIVRTCDFVVALQVPVDAVERVRGCRFLPCHIPLFRIQ